MKSLFQNIRAGVITKPACEAQLNKFKSERNELTQDYLGRKMGHDLYRKKLADLNFCVEVLKSIVEKYETLRMPLKTKP